MIKGHICSAASTVYKNIHVHIPLSYTLKTPHLMVLVISKL